MTRVAVSGPELAGFALEEPAASVRLLLPRPGGLEIPTWTGNRFRHADGSAADIRTLTPRRFIASRSEMHLDVVHHRGGVLTPWVEGCLAGGRPEVAVSGPGRGYRIDGGAPGYHLIGDESAIPAICQLLEYLPDVPISVDVGIRFDDARVDLHRDVTTRWHVVEAIEDLGARLVESLGAELSEVAIWAAGEAGAMHAIRTLLRSRDVDRDRFTVRGYWKQKQSSD